MKRAKLEVKEETVIIDGKEYPKTEHNLLVWNDYLITEDRKILKDLSTIVLDI